MSLYARMETKDKWSVPAEARRAGGIKLICRATADEIRYSSHLINYRTSSAGPLGAPNMAVACPEFINAFRINDV